MSTYEEEITERYRQMDSEELVERARSGNLTSSAQEVAAAELSKRGISLDYLPSDLAAEIEGKSAAKSALSPPLKGVGGWLYYLIGILVFVTPALRAKAVLSNFQYATNSMAEIPGYLTAVGVDATMNIFLSIGSIYCGFLLWKIRPYAVLATKIFFVANILYVIFGIFIITALSSFPPQIEKALELGATTNLARDLMPAVFWMIYLSRSKRVKATYK